jgi:phage tail-like protein
MSTNTSFLNAIPPHDPYHDFKFRLKWDGNYVAGVSQVSDFTHPTQEITRRSGGDPSTPRRMPGQSEHESITLERGVTHDLAFELWANKVWDYHNSSIDDQQHGTANQDVSLKDFRKDIVLEVYNEAGQKVLAYIIYRCWPSEFKAVPEFDANGNAVAIQSLKLENDGWEPDTSVQEPTEPSFTLPAK